MTEDLSKWRRSEGCYGYSQTTNVFIQASRGSNAQTAFVCAPLQNSEWRGEAVVKFQVSVMPNVQYYAKFALRICAKTWHSGNHPLMMSWRALHCSSIQPGVQTAHWDHLKTAFLLNPSKRLKPSALWVAANRGLNMLSESFLDDRSCKS